MNAYLLQYLKPITVFVLASTFFVACSDVYDENLIPTGNELQIHVTAQGFISEKNETRTSENGYVTAFSPGDTIGITAVKDGNISQDNVPYVYNGSSWLPAHNPIYKYNNGAIYFAYYPYNSANDGKSPTEIVNIFEPKLDQSNYDDYSQSDLMTWSGLFSGTSVEIKMEHKFALVEINPPSNAKNITLKRGNQDVVPYNFNGTYRYIAKPASDVTLSGTHTVDAEVIEWHKDGIRLEEKKYIRLNISNPELSITDGYKGNFRIIYTDGTSEDIKINDNGVMQFKQGKNKTIKEFVLLDKGNKTYAIGRKVSSAPINLNFDNNGDLLFRNDVDGYIPIGSYAEFQLIRNKETTIKKFKQEADLDLMDMEWEPVYSASSLNNSFRGVYDGTGYKIFNLKINKPASDNVGLFSKIYESDTIKNVHIASGSITGKKYTGAISGYNYGLVYSCSNLADIVGTSASTGGIVGYNSGNNVGVGEIIACYNGGTVTGTVDVGGIAGYNGGTGGTVGKNAKIFACYNTAPIKGKTDNMSSAVGGIIGTNYSKDLMVAACYNTGMVEDVGQLGVGTTLTSLHSASIVGDNMANDDLSGCYWLTNTSEKGIGKGNGNDSVIEFDPYFTPLNIPEWGTGNGETNGWWKAGTTNGNQLPKLWWE